uniref:Arrestin domain-containing protein 3 n=1 Tax=Cacopsylla melanoneura TaxID=428564 RepID=A0A8D8VAD8_9HEMI
MVVTDCAPFNLLSGSGTLAPLLINPLYFTAITIEFLGEAKNQWLGAHTERMPNGENKTHNVNFMGSEEYYKFKYNLLGGGGAEMEIPQGSHVYPFTSTLPPSLPSSFDGEHGYVRYKVTATLDRPWKFDEHAEGVFYVVTLYDLNTDMKAKETIHQEVSKNFCCLWCQSGPLQLILAAPFSGFVPGQTVPLSIDVENGSNVAVDKVTVELTKYMTWKATEPTSSEKQDKLDLVTEELGGVVVNSSKHWNHQLVVPVFPYVNLTNCHIIQQEFKLSVTAKVSGPHKDLVIKVPIVLGSVPIAEHSSVQSSLPAPTQPLAPQQNQMQNQAPPPPIGLNVNNLYPSIPAIDASPVSPTY